jgi:hypothetical protein
VLTGLQGTELEEMEPGATEIQPDESLVVAPSDRGIISVGLGAGEGSGARDLVQLSGVPCQLSICSKKGSSAQQLPSRMQRLPSSKSSPELQAPGNGFWAVSDAQQQQHIQNVSYGVSSTNSSSSSSPTTYSMPGLLALVRALLHSYTSGALVSSGLAVQNSLDDLATAAEKLLAALSGIDAVATSLVYAMLLLFVVAVAVAGPGCVTFVAVCWLLRPPAFRTVPGWAAHKSLCGHMASQSTDSNTM